MRIAILGTRGIPARYGGFETCAEQVALGLCKSRHQMTVFCPHWQEYRKRTYKKVKLRSIFDPTQFFTRDVYRSLGSLVYDFISLLTVSFMRIDIVYMMGYASSPFCILPRLFGKKIVINTDGLEWKRKRWSKIARAWLRFCEYAATRVAHCLVSDSKAVQTYFLKEYGLSTVFLPYGAPVTADKKAETEKPLKEFGLEPESYYIVVARIVPETSISMILQGFANTKIKRNLVLVGPIAHQDYFTKKIAPLLKADSRTRYLGAIYDKQKLLALRQNAFAYLHGHTGDGTNPSLLESMGAGNIVIARTVNSNKEVLGPNGLFFNSPAELSNAIQTAEDLKSEARASIRNENQQRIKQNYLWEGIVNNYDKLFKKILSS